MPPVACCESRKSYWQQLQLLLLFQGECLVNESLVTAVRGVMAFFTLLILCRVLGKQQVSQLTFFEYVLGITIGSIASSMTVDLSINALPQWIGLFTWTLAVLILQWATIKWRGLAKYVDGEPTIVAMNGKLMEQAMQKMRYRASDLMEQLRVQGVFDLKQVAYAVLEPSGQLSVVKRPEEQAVTRKDIGLCGEPVGLDVELIYSGAVVEQNLTQVGVSRNWLLGQLKLHGLAGPEDVFLATIDAGGNLFVDPYQDRMRQLTDVDDDAAGEGQHAE